MMSTLFENTLSTTLTMRGFRGEADYPVIFAIIDACRLADGGEHVMTLEGIATNYAHLYNCDPERDMLFVEAEGQAVAYTRVWWLINGEGTWLGYQAAYIHPEWRRKGIGMRLLSFGETRMRQISDGLIARGELPAKALRMYENFVSEKEVARTALLEKAGYQAVRYAFGMVRPDLDDIPDAPMPPGLVVRLVQPDEYRKVWDASQEAFQDHWGYVRQPDEEYEKWLESPEFDPTLFKVAWDGEEVAGMVLSFINVQENEEYQRKRGYTENISVRRPYRRQGLARSLLVQSLHVLKERGLTEAALGVDSENISGALHLYESVGFRVVERSTIYRKPME
jgi:ribosomal protein S18 acetylase RimI-like enzyme